VDRSGELDSEELLVLIIDLIRRKGGVGDWDLSPDADDCVTLEGINGKPAITVEIDSKNSAVIEGFTIRSS